MQYTLATLAERPELEVQLSALDQEAWPPFDPWIRTHTRLGAKILKVAQQSMIITGAIEEWEE